MKPCTSPFSFQLALMWEEKLKEEASKTRPLEEVCHALREELDAAHKERIQAFEIKMKPIIIKDGPSKKVSFPILDSARFPGFGVPDSIIFRRGKKQKREAHSSQFSQEYKHDAYYLPLVTYHIQIISPFA